MAVSYTEAVAAYRRAFDQAQSAAPGANQNNAANDTPSFGEVLRQEAKDSVQALEKGEQQSLAAAAGEANLNDAVMAMSKAEMTLQSVTAVRDKAVEAYKHIMRMPI